MISILSKTTCFLWVVASLGVSFACSKQESSGAKKDDVLTSSHDLAPPAAEAADSKIEQPAYTVAWLAPGPYMKDKEQASEIVIEAKAGYHVNQEFPLQFKPVEGADGISYKGPIGRENAKIQEAKAVVTVAFTPTRTGKVKLAGTLTFSVCSDQTCLREKKNLEVAANVQ